MSESSPLLEIFHRLRERQFPLGPQEYLNAERALACSFEVDSRKKLLFLCQTLWAKSREEQEIVAEVFDLVLPPVFSPQELDMYLNEREQEMQPHAEERVAPVTRQPPSVPPSDSGAPSLSSKTDVPGSATITAAQSQKLNIVPRASAFEIHLPEPRVRDWPINPAWDFVSQLPLTKRQLKGAWRYLRRMRRSGQRIELDIESTIEQTYRQGVLLEPVLMARRTNQARLLLLVDEGGSMIPFRHLTQALIESAQQSGLAEVVVRYFHDMPLRYFFRAPQMSQQHAEKLETVLENFANSSVLILSDGGAARGTLDENRVSQSITFLRKIRRQRAFVTWLNPTPKSRWANTTAAMIEDQGRVKMLSYDRAGVDAAVRALRGKEGK